MKKNNKNCCLGWQWQKILLMMKFAWILIFTGLMSANAMNSYSQNTRLNLKMESTSLKSILNEIEAKTGYNFFYKNNEIEAFKKLSIDVEQATLSDVLTRLLKNKGLEYKVYDKYILIREQGQDMSDPNVQEKKIKISGHVTDKDGAPLPGVTVLIKGTTIGTITNGDGKFTFDVPDKKGTILFSFVGMKPQEFPLASQNYFKVVMEDEAIGLNEVVVTALGIEKETKSLTYNVQKIDAQEISAVKDVNFVNGLAGKVAGVTINSSSSGIGGGARVVMRGTKSISGNNNALYVVDGVPLPNLFGSQPDDQYSGAGQTGDGMANFNADDIESVSVLSGSAAAALYGSAAANGVVLITTRKGSVNKTRLSYNNNVTFYSPFVLPKFQNKYGSESGEWYSWASEMSTPSSYDVDDFFQTGYNVAHTVSLSTGNEKNQSYFSVGTVNARGIIHNNDLDRYNFSARNTTNLLNNKLTIDFSFIYSKIKEQNMLAQGEYANPLVPVYLFPRGDDIAKYRYYERYDVDRNIKVQYWPISDNGLSMQNPYWITNRNMYNNGKDRFLASGSVKYKVADWINISGRVKLDKNLKESEKKMYASTLTVLSENSDKGAYIENNSHTTQIYADVMLNINKYFAAKKWNLTATFGASLLDLKHEENSFGGGLLTIPNLFTINNVDVTGKLTYKDNDYHDRTNSVFATASLGYRGMVYLDGSLRNDWLSALAGTDHSSILYPSVGTSFILTNIFGLHSNILSYAKARVSYSEVGNAPERFKAITTYSVKGGLSTTSYFPITDLAPERTHSWEAGLNLAFFNNKLTLDVTGYKSYTENQLFSPDISTTTGYSKLYVNAGKVTNKGIELALGFKQRIGSVNYKSTVLWSLNRNRIDKLLPEYTNEELGVTVHLDEMDVYTLGGAKQRLTVGGSMGDVYVNTMRTDEHGAIWINSMTGALETDKTNYVYAGNTNPKYNLSWRNEFNWKGFNLAFMLSARVGGIGVSATQAVLDYYGVSEASANARDNGGVTVNGQSIDAQTWYQTVGANGVDFIGSMYVYSMTNVRLAETTLGYTIPVKKWVNFVDNMKVSLVGHNLLMLYNKAPFDPESSASTGTYNQCMDYFIQPSLRSLGFAVNVTF